MSFYNQNDIALDNQLNEIKKEMGRALELIDICEDDPSSEFNTHPLKKDIERFLEDWWDGWRIVNIYRNIADLDCY